MLSKQFSSRYNNLTPCARKREEFNQRCCSNCQYSQRIFCFVSIDICLDSKAGGNLKNQTKVGPGTSGNAQCTPPNSVSRKAPDIGGTSGHSGKEFGTVPSLCSVGPASLWSSLSPSLLLEGTDAFTLDGDRISAEGIHHILNSTNFQLAAAEEYREFCLL